MNETVDQTQWLPRNTPVVNAFRMAKGDMDGRVSAKGVVVQAQVKDATILASLIDRGFLEEHHRECAMAFLELRHAFFGPLQYRLNATSLEQITGTTNRAEVKDALGEIMKLLTLKKARIIEHACNTSAIDDAACQIIQGINVYQNCFELLSKISDDVWQKMREKTENACAQ